MGTPVLIVESQKDLAHVAKDQPLQITHKKCPACGILLEREHFASNRHAKDGLSAWCRRCLKRKYRIIAEKEDQELRVIENGEEKKKCARCERILPLQAYTRLPRSKNRYRAVCMECVSKLTHGKPRRNSFEIPTSVWLVKELHGWQRESDPVLGF